MNSINNILSRFLMIVGFCLIGFSASAAERATVFMKVSAFRGPITNSVNYIPWVEQTKVSVLSDDWGIDTLMPEYLNANLTNKNETQTVWFSVHIWSAEPFDPSKLFFNAKSSDRDNIFGKSDRYDLLDYTYGHSSEGVIWASSAGRGVSDVHITSGLWKGQLVNEFAFVGSATKTMNANTESQAASNVAWMNSIPNFNIIGTWTLTEGGVTVAEGAKKLSNNGNRVPWKISINRQGSSQLILGVSGEAGNTAIIESTDLNIWPLSWHPFAMVKSGDEVLVNKSSLNTAYRIRGD